MRWLNILFVALLVLAVLQIAYYYPQLPYIIASHFNSTGSPDLWAGKDDFFILYGAILLLLVAVFLYLPKWSMKPANFSMKIPNREYWLAPERIEQTRLFFRRQMLIMGIASLLLAILVIQLAIIANFNHPPVLDRRVNVVLISYFVFTGIWLVHFFLHFRKPG